MPTEATKMSVLCTSSVLSIGPYLEEPKTGKEKRKTVESVLRWGNRMEGDPVPSWGKVGKKRLQMSRGPAVWVEATRRRRRGIHRNELKAYFHMETCLWMFRAAFFMSGETWKQPRCPSVGECIHTPRCVEDSGIFFAIKKY